MRHEGRHRWCTTWGMGPGRQSKAYTGRWNRYRINSLTVSAKESACPDYCNRDRCGCSRTSHRNVSHSPWADRVEVICHDFRDYQPENRFDLIVSNPPYFIDALKCPDEQRCTARHAGNLNYDLLFHRSASLLEEQGVVSIIIPAEAEKTVVDTAWNHKLFPLHRVQVFTKPGKPCRRVLLNFGFEAKECREEKLCIEVNHNEFTPEYVALTKDFYLKM